MSSIGSRVRLPGKYASSGTLDFRSPPFSATLQPIFHKRIGADTFVSRMARLREDSRFKAIGPDVLVVDVTVDEAGAPGLPVGESATDGEGEIWMDWAFVEFWKESYCKIFPLGLCVDTYCLGLLDTIQKSITTDPNSAAAEVGKNNLSSIHDVE